MKYYLNKFTLTNTLILLSCFIYILNILGININYYLLYDFPTFWKGLLDKNFQFLIFNKINNGEYWRIISPIFLHFGILHILFNMAWLFQIGNDLEEKLPKYKYILLILITSAISNTAQYLISGASFGGFSGVLYGFILFIKVTKKIYYFNLDIRIINSAIKFMFILLAIDMLLSLLNTGINIANTAHISGAVTGYLLGKLEIKLKRYF